MAKVSVIIPTHSRPQLLPRAVKSAFEAGTNVEVIVVDDASTDETQEVCRLLEGIKYIRVERNQRVAGARNLGIMASSGEYIAFLDDDDIRLPESLNIQIEAFENNPEIGLVYGQIYYGDENCVPTTDPPQPAECPQGDIFWQLMSRNFIFCQSAVFRKSCIYKVGLLDKELQGIDDKDLWVRILELYSSAAVKSPVAVWRKASGSSEQGSSNLSKLLKLEYSAYHHKWSQLPRVKKASALQRKQHRQLFLKSVTNGLIWSAAEKLKEKLYISAIKDIIYSFRYAPLNSLHPKSAQLFLKSLRHSK